MQTLVWTVFGMPLVIFLAAGWAAIHRLRLESHGLRVRATVTSYRRWMDDMTHHDVMYRFVAGGKEYTGSGSADRSCQVGEQIDVLYHAQRPDFNGLAAGTIAHSVGVNVIIMVAMVATELWLASLLPR